MNKGLDLLLPLSKAADADAHASRDVSLRDDADGEAQCLLDPLSDPFAGVDAAALHDLSNLIRDVGRRSGVGLLVALARRRQRGRRIQPSDPAEGDVLARRAVHDVVDGVEDVDGEADLRVGAVIRDGARLLLHLVGGAAGKERRVRLNYDGLDREEDVARPDGIVLA